MSVVPADLNDVQRSVLGALCRLPIGWKITYTNLCVRGEGPSTYESIRRTSALGVLECNGYAIEVEEGSNMFAPTEAGRQAWKEINA